MFRTLMQVAKVHDLVHQGGNDYHDSVLVIHVFVTTDHASLVTLPNVVGEVITKRAMMVPRSEIPFRMFENSDLIDASAEVMLREWWIKYKHSISIGPGILSLTFRTKPTAGTLHVLLLQSQPDIVDTWMVL